MYLNHSRTADDVHWMRGYIRIVVMRTEARDINNGLTHEETGIVTNDRILYLA